ncbi:MAG: hypothetical protein IPK64_16525 [bacterium]|nr:hypothetical protein [bacterium]
MTRQDHRIPRAQRAVAICTALGLGLLAGTGAQAATTPHRSAAFEMGATTGFGARADVTLHDITRDLPLSLRLGVGYAGRDAGDPLAARRVFINNNTNGTPDESGHSWQLRLDLVRPVARLGQAPVNLGVGVRKAYFTGTFDYIGGNENFDVTCRPWGLGFALDTAFAVGQSTSLTFAAGLDRYFGATMEGHDTAYSPDGTAINAQDDYAWADADDAINQPRWELTAVMGLRWHLGR